MLIAQVTFVRNTQFEINSFQNCENSECKKLMPSLYQVISVFKAKFISFLKRTIRKSSSLDVFLLVVTKYKQFHIVIR